MARKVLGSAPLGWETLTYTRMKHSLRGYLPPKRSFMFAPRSTGTFSHQTNSKGESCLPLKESHRRQHGQRHATVPSSSDETGLGGERVTLGSRRRLTLG